MAGALELSVIKVTWRACLMIYALFLQRVASKRNEANRVVMLPSPSSGNTKNR